MCVGRICCILVAIPSYVQVSGEVGKTCTTLRTARCIQQLTKGEVTASGAACLISSRGSQNVKAGASLFFGSCLCGILLLLPS